MDWRHTAQPVNIDLSISKEEAMRRFVDFKKRQTEWSIRYMEANLENILLQKPLVDVGPLPEWEYD